MRVAIIGAGLSGIGAGRELALAGITAVIFEKSAGLGGRCATRRIGEYIFDHGATSIAPGDGPLAALFATELNDDDLVEVTRPIYTHSALRVAAGSIYRNTKKRYTFKSGNTHLAKVLSANLDVRLNAAVEEIVKEGETYQILGEYFDAIILTPPIPQSSILLWQLKERKATANVVYRSCLSILLGYKKAVDVPYHAIIDTEQRHPLGWLSIESLKSPGRAPEGHSAFVAQLGASYSQENYADSDEELVSLCAGFLQRLYGGDWSSPEVSGVVRWKYSQPEGLASITSLNQPGDRVILTGDACLGPRTEQAYESGVLAARLLIDKP